MNRRNLLRQSVLGLGALGSKELLEKELLALGSNHKGRIVHHPARAKNVIFMHMVGGPSQMDTFDPKPALNKWDGKPLPKEITKGRKFAFITPESKVIKSPYKFAPRGQSGIVMSDLFPNLAKVADDLAMIRSMTSTEINHGSGELFFHTGHPLLGRPTFGAWTTYGLDTDNKNLPAYVVLKDSSPVAGPPVWGNGFLPSKHQGVAFRKGKYPLFFLEQPESTNALERRHVVNAIHQLNSKAFDRYRDPEIVTRTAQYELAHNMQSTVPELVDFSSESSHTLKLYGLENANAPQFARNCLLARRLVEQGVRFVQIFNGGWDHHANIYGTLPKSATEVDKACAGLIQDLKQRGMLDETLVIWGGEFGRTPMVQENNAGTGAKTAPGRDHHKDCFSIWMAGGGIKGGVTYGKTDEFGFGVLENEVNIHDFHATCLHLLGIDHELLTYRTLGRDFRLTDVHGHVVRDILL